MYFDKDESISLSYFKNLYNGFKNYSVELNQFLSFFLNQYGSNEKFKDTRDRANFLFNSLSDFVLKLNELCVLYEVDLSLESSQFVSEITSVLNKDKLNGLTLLSSFIYSFESYFSSVLKKPFNEGRNDLVNINNAVHRDLNFLYDFFVKAAEDNNYNNVGFVRGEIEKINNKLNKLDESFRLNFENENKIFKKKSDDVIQKFNDDLVMARLEFKVNVEDQAEELKNKVSSVDSDFKNTVKDYETLKKFINAKGEVEVTDHYRKKAITESRTYWAMTILTFGIIIFSISLALKGLNEYKEKSDISIDKMLVKYKDQPVEKIEKINNAVQRSALTYLILRLIFSLLLFSTIIYTSRIAYRAYIHMRHSENMMLKLATLRPFINQLDEAERNQIHKDLVPDYFGKDAGMVDGVNEKFKDLPANVSAVAMKAIEQIGSGGSSSEGKNDKKEEV